MGFAANWAELGACSISPERFPLAWSCVVHVPLHLLASTAERSCACRILRSAWEGGLSPSGTAAEPGELGTGGFGAQGLLLGRIPSQQGEKISEGNQLFLSNLTFETSRNISCRVIAPSVPGLEQSKQVAVAVQGKNRHVCGHAALPEGVPSCPASAPFPSESHGCLMCPSHREAADRRHQLPAVRAAG